MRSKFVIFAFCMLLGFSMTGSALTFTGALIEREVSPGDVISHQITLSLSGNETSMEAVGGVYGYGMGLDGARIHREDTEEMKPYSAVGFLKLTPERAQVEEGAPAVFLLEGRVPEDVGSGGRYALVEIHTPPQGEGQVGIALATIAPIRLTIAGTDLVESGEISSLNVSADGVSVIFKNTGNHHFKASAEAALMDAEDEVVATSEAPLMYTSLVPTASWLFDMAFEAEEELAPGTYTVEVSVIHEDGTVLDTEETTFEV
jgi:hypothetical protein